jgi:DNA-binding NarL/FixJ family response regulator
VTSVLVVTDVLLYREGLTLFLGRDGRVAVAGAVDADGAVDAATAARPDVVLLDTTMPSYELVASALAREAPDARLLALTVPETEQAVVACAAAGAVGYVTRASSLDDLVAAIEGATRDEVIASPRMAGVLLRRAAAANGPTETRSPLTARQHEIGLLLADGLSNKEIARRLCIEVTTVKNHVHQILERLQVTQRADVQAALGRSGVNPGT